MFPFGCKHEFTGKEYCFSPWGNILWSEGGHFDTDGEEYDVKQIEEHILNQSVSLN